MTTQPTCPECEAPIFEGHVCPGDGETTPEPTDPRCPIDTVISDARLDKLESNAHSDNSIADALELVEALRAMKRDHDRRVKEAVSKERDWFEKLVASRPLAGETIGKESPVEFFVGVLLDVIRARNQPGKSSDES